jgi:tRNA 2-thiouridine synthesizing protein A
LVRGESGAMLAPMSDLETVLDLRGVRCPHVVLRAKKALRAVPVGGTLVLECTDPLTAIDVPHFVTQTGHTLGGYRQQDALHVFRIVKQH